MFKSLLKNRAIKKYYRILPKHLAKAYARSSFYTPAQVRAVIAKQQLPDKYEPYAVVMFTSFEDTGSIFQREYPALNGYKIRAEVADLIFEGDMHYAIKKNLKLSEHGNGGTDPMSGGTQ